MRHSQKIAVQLDIAVFARKLRGHPVEPAETVVAQTANLLPISTEVLCCVKLCAKKRQTASIAKFKRITKCVMLAYVRQSSRLLQSRAESSTCLPRGASPKKTRGMSVSGLTV